MTVDQAQNAVSLSAFTVASVFAYRKLVEPATQSKTTPAVGHFVIGFGFTYIVLSLLAQAAPEIGGMFAILVATGDVLANGNGLLKDLTGALGAAKTATGGNS